LLLLQAKYANISSITKYRALGRRITVPFSKARLQKINDCLDMMARRLDQIEAQRARDDAEDDLEELEEEQFTNPLDAPPSAPFADSPPEKIHGQPEE
jgi:hypothetical protein